MDETMQGRAIAAVFGATGGIGKALVATLAERGWRVAAGSRDGEAVPGSASRFTFDLTDEDSIVNAAKALVPHAPSLVVVATGALTLPGGLAPEKSLRQIDPVAMARAFALNATGPALIAKHMLPHLPRDRRSVFAMLGARVGSIGDNRLGGWHSYRASKAALSMLVRTIAIEAARTHPQAVIAALHPGTVDTSLSSPFQRNLAEGQLTDRATAAKRLLEVVERLTPAESGGHFDWRGEPIAP
jgi:NAD(P)-dependent dehydrogenase (short-subunit alcohol dehydrogenase family)